MIYSAVLRAGGQGLYLYRISVARKLPEKLANPIYDRGEAANVHISSYRPTMR